MGDPFVPDRDEIEAEAGIATADAIQLLWLLTNQIGAGIEATAAAGVVARYYDQIISDTNDVSALGKVGVPSGVALTGHGLALESGSGERWVIHPGQDAYDSFLTVGMQGVGSFGFERALSIYYNSAANRFEVGPRGAGVGAATTQLGNANGSAHRFSELHVTDIYEKGRTVAQGAWQDYTPTWAGTVSNPAIGNGTLLGRYALIGKTLHFRVFIQMGSTTTFGSGIWTLSLPAGFSTPAAEMIFGTCVAFDADTTTYYLAAATRNDNTSFLMTLNTAGFISPTAPMTWATSDRLTFAGTVEIQ